MRHKTERQRLNDGRLGWRCTACDRWWVRDPVSFCPGVLTFSTWDDAQAAGYRTLTQWRKERRRVVPAALPSAALTKAPVHPNDWYDLYTIEQTKPMRTASEAQRTVLARGGETQRHCKLCGREINISESREFGGHCYNCIRRLRDEPVRIQASQDAAALLAADDWVLIDTETTGLEYPEIIEIAIVAHDGTVLLDAMVKPFNEIEEGAQWTHGLTAENLVDAPAWPEVWPKVRQAIFGKRIVAYNDSFDRRALRVTCEIHGMHTIKKTWVDVMTLYAGWFGDYNEKYDDYTWRPLPGGHRALDDCRATLMVLQEMAHHPEWGYAAAWER